MTTLFLAAQGSNDSSSSRRRRRDLAHARKDRRTEHPGWQDLLVGAGKEALLRDVEQLLPGHVSQTLALLNGLEDVQLGALLRRISGAAFEAAQGHRDRSSGFTDWCCCEAKTHSRQQRQPVVKSTRLGGLDGLQDVCLRGRRGLEHQGAISGSNARVASTEGSGHGPAKVCELQNREGKGGGGRTAENPQSRSL